MAGRFESAELRREARVHEENSAKPGLLGRYTCLFGTVLTIAGLVSPVLSLKDVITQASSDSSSLAFEEASEHVSSPAAMYSSAAASAAAAAADVSGSSASGLGFGFGYDPHRASSYAPEEPRRLGFDFSLLAFCGTIFALCMLPSCLRVPMENPGSPGWASPQTWPTGNPWAAGNIPAAPVGWPGSSPMAGTAGGGMGYGPYGQPSPPLGSYGQGFYGSYGAPSPMGRWDLRSGSPAYPWQSPMLQQPATGFFGSGGAGSTLSSMGQSLGSLGLGLLGGFTGMGGASASSGTGWPGLGSLHGQGGQAAQHWGAGSSFPTESEIAETYATLGVELQQWVPSLIGAVDRFFLEPMLRSLEESDSILAPFLSQHGWRLSMEAPRIAQPGIGTNMQELSIFDRHLPRPLSDFPQVKEMWDQRQKLESYLLHPSFEPAQRHYVLTRLKDWRARGLANGMHHNQRASDHLPTDAHILENLLIKMLNHHVDFGTCFLSSGHAPPQAKHLGQPPIAFLRQVTDQMMYPKPPPHYEVATQGKVFRLRPGNNNLFEALAILMHALRKSNSRSYQSFPQLLRQATEQALPTIRSWS